MWLPSDDEDEDVDDVQVISKFALIEKITNWLNTAQAEVTEKT